MPFIESSEWYSNEHVLFLNCLPVFTPKSVNNVYNYLVINKYSANSGKLKVTC